MRFDEFNKNDKGERLDELGPLAPLAVGAARVAAPLVKKGAQELGKRAAPLVKKGIGQVKKGAQELGKKAKDWWKGKPKVSNKPPNVTTTACLLYTSPSPRD